MSKYLITEPLEVLILWDRAWADRDAEGIASLFAEAPEFVNVVGLWWHDREAIRQAHAYGFDVIFGESTFEFISHRVRSLGSAGAVVHGKWKMTGQHTPQGVDTGERFGIFVFVLERDGQHWKVVAAQNTDIIAGAESIAVVEGQSSPASYR